MTHATLELIIALLGIPARQRKAIQSVGDIEPFLKAGLPNQALAAAADDFSPAELADLLGISRRGYYDLLKRSSLSPPASDRFFRLALALAQATHLFGTRERALTWLRTGLPALGGETPLSKLSTQIGTARVSEVLAAIEYGVYV